MTHLIKFLIMFSATASVAASAYASTLIPPEDAKNLLFYPHCNLSSGACIIPADKDYAVLTVDPNGPKVCDIIIKTAGIKLEDYSDLSPLNHIVPYLYRQDQRLQYKFAPQEQADGSLVLSMTGQWGTIPLQGLYLKSPNQQNFEKFLHSKYENKIGLYGQVGLIAIPTLCAEQG